MDSELDRYRNGGEREKGHGYDCDGFHGFAVVLHDVAIMLGDDVEGLRISQQRLLDLQS